jgi:hypothetical protein
MQQLRIWDFLDLHSLQLNLAEAATQFASEHLVS